MALVGMLNGGGGGGGGFFTRMRGSEGRFDESLPACAFFSSVFEWRLARAREFHSLGQNQCRVAQRLWPSVPLLRVSSFP